MPPAGHDPAWPDKAMFAALLLILAGVIGLAFQLVKPLMTIDEARMPSIMANEWTSYELMLCGATVLFGILSLRRQAATFAYLGAACAIASLAVYGLLPLFGLLAILAMVKSHLEGEETRNDGIQMHSRNWPDKALAASLFLLVVACISLLQGTMILLENFEPILLKEQYAVAGSLGIIAGIVGIIASREVFHLRRPWVGWLGATLGLATLGFFLIGPLLAVTAMGLLMLAHKEDEFLSPDGQAAQTPSTTTSGAARGTQQRKRGRARAVSK